MEFDLLLLRITDLLKERGRISYPALRQYFDLTDDLLEAVKAELVFARQTARDENGVVLVWNDGRGSFVERRHLTVMFADLVGSTALSQRLDPEEYRDVVREFQLTVYAVIDQHGGHVAQYLGDGMLVYFGYPLAHEHDAQRAVAAALAVFEALDQLNRRLQVSAGTRLEARIGIHTGLVVVDEIGAGERAEKLALGDTPNIAARLEGEAEPGTVYVSGATRALIGDLFDVEQRGERALKGVTNAIAVYEVTDSSGVRSRFDLAVQHKLLPLAGRRRELALLTGQWERARGGAGSAVMITGIPGIGKSRLLQALKDHVSGEDFNWGAIRCSPVHTNTPLYPIIDLWRQLLELEPDDGPERQYFKLEQSLAPFRLDHEAAVPAFARLMSIPLPPGTKARAPSMRQLLGTLVSIVAQNSERRLRLFVIEDLQWADPSTIELTRLLLKRIREIPMLIAMTARSGFDETSLGEVEYERLVVAHMPRADVARMVTAVAGGRTVAKSVHDTIYERTDGVPAFVEELTKMLLQSGWLRDDHGHLVPEGPPPAGIPATLQDSLMARLDRLGDAKSVAQMAAVIGRKFPLRLLRSIADLPEASFDDALARLIDADVVERRDSAYGNQCVFTHVFLQEAAYESLLKSTRQAYHRKIAETLEAQFESLVDRYPAMVAQHFARAQLDERAIGYWQWAGEAAVERSANHEALTHLQAGLDLVRRQPESDLREQRELAFLTTIGPALVAVRGWAAPELEEVFARVTEIITASGDLEDADFQVLGGLCAFHLLRGDYPTVHALAKRLYRQARRNDDPAGLLAAETCIGGAYFNEGRLDLSREHLDAALAHYDPHSERLAVSFLYGQDPGIICGCWLALIQWMQGDIDEADKRSKDTVRLAGELGNPFAHAFALAWDARLDYLRGEYLRAREQAENAIGLAAEHDFAVFIAVGKMIEGAAQAQLDPSGHGAASVREGVAMWRATGSESALTYYYAMLAEAEHVAGHNDAARRAVADGLAAADRYGESFWRSELERLRGELSGADDAQDHFRLALSIAADQGAHLLGLRAALGYARALNRLGKPERGREILESSLGHFAPSSNDDISLRAARDLMSNYGMEASL